MRLRIIIDNLDAESNPESPYTLAVFRDDDDGDQSRMPKDIGNFSCMVGVSITDMLRTLADAIENGDVGDPGEFNTCERCGDWNDDGEGWNGLCGNCADRAENEKEGSE